MELSFGGVFDLRPLVDALQEGLVLDTRQLSAVASTLEAAEMLEEAILADGAPEDDRVASGSRASTSEPGVDGQPKLAKCKELRRLAESISQFPRHIFAEIRRCLHQCFASAPVRQAEILLRVIQVRHGAWRCGGRGHCRASGGEGGAPRQSEAAQGRMRHVGT